MSVYNSKAWSIKFATPFVKLILLFSFLLCVDVLLLLVYITVNDNFQTVFLSDKKFYDFIIFLFKIIIIGYLIAVVIGIVYPTEKKISCMVRTRLFSYEYGNPLKLKDAMSTKILFRPTLTEARLMWESDKLQTLAERVYNAGDAWFSSTDGVHDDVSYVRFPLMNFSVYKELGELLNRYYD